MSFLPLVTIWLLVSAAASIAGWVLSASSELNRVGYAVFAVAALGLALRMCRRSRSLWPGPIQWRKARRRFGRLLPASFVVLAALAFFGGALYPPTNHAGLTYRTARVLQWLTHGSWFWIHSPNYRMNDRTCGFEWLSAPLLLFTKSDRALFLLNFLPFLLMPGLVFSLFTRLGVKPRVAWRWMWIVPTGYTFLLQAGSIGNDAFPTVYVLAAFDFALRAWKSRRVSDLWFSILAAALLTGAKPSNLPLLLTWGLLMVGTLPLLRRRPVATVGVLLAALVISFLPTAILNVVHCGDWTGLKLERAGMNMKNPIVGIWGNGFLFLLDNFVPPFFPLAGWWNRSALNILPHFMAAPLVANFEEGFHMLWEIPSEDWSGFGFGLSVLLLVSFIAVLFRGARPRRTHAGARSEFRLLSPLAWRKLPFDLARCQFSAGVRWLILLSPWLALLAFCVKSGMATGARLITPYYPLLLPAILVAPGNAALVRQRWWKALAMGVVLLAFPVLMLTPPRPLWPALTILGRLSAARPGSHLLTRALQAYTIYRDRSDPMPQVRDLLPGDPRVVGFMADGDDLDISLWRPFFTRRVEHILLADSADDIRRRGIQYAVVGGSHLNATGVRLEDWLLQTRAELVAQTTVLLKLNEGPQKWYVVRFKAGSP